METSSTKKYRQECFWDFVPLVLGFRRKVTAALAVVVLCLATAGSTFAQTFTKLVDFNGTNGSAPENGSLAQGRDGNLWGATASGGANGLGTVFNVTPAGTLTTVLNFSPGEASMPFFAPILGLDGNFYGTAAAGSIYELTPGGALTVLATLNTPGGLVQGRDGNFYVVLGGGLGGGDVVKVTPLGSVSTLHAFTGTDGTEPEGALVQGTDGNFYGTTAWGGNFWTQGTETGGTVFKITPTGNFTSLYSFDYPNNPTDGETLTGALIQAKDGNFYGTSEQGGTYGYGTIFKITPSGGLTPLYSFDVTHGQAPCGPLVQGTDGNLYGTTYAGGANGLGTLFQITTSGVLTVLHSFSSTDGSYPNGSGLTQHTNGKFYGFTSEGGANNDGTLFSLDMGLGPFVETLPTSGKIGTPVGILGSGLTGATSVTFNGTAATFRVTSDTYITTSVPSNATTGPVKVVVTGHTYTSNVKFRVTPKILSFTPLSGSVGTSVTITGNSLTGATAVTFGGVRATTFTVNSYTQITAMVPTGAKTGKIGVTTPGGTALSTSVFTVTQ